MKINLLSTPETDLSSNNRRWGCSPFSIIIQKGDNKKGPALELKLWSRRDSFQILTFPLTSFPTSSLWDGFLTCKVGIKANYAMYSLREFK